MTKEEAIAMYDSGWWIGKPAKEVALFQLREEKLCMPFDVFQAAVEEAAGHPVFTHQMIHVERLIAECES